MKFQIVTTEIAAGKSVLSGVISLVVNWKLLSVCVSIKIQIIL